jgi:tetratricopeptide (TPR) repeat protein
MGRLTKTEEFRQAMECYRKAKALDPKHHGGWVGPAHIAMNDGRFEEALELSEHAINACPEHAYSWQLRGEIHDRMERYDLAAEDYTRVLELEPSQSSDFNWYRRRALVLFKWGRYTDALADVAKASELKPGDLRTLTCIKPELVASCPDGS